MNTTDLKWNEIYNRGIDVANIRRDSEEYQIMYSAAVRGIPSAEYYLGLWVAKVNKRPDVARIWLARAASKDYQEASETIQGLDNETGFSTKNSVETSLLNIQNVNTNYRYTDTTNPTTSLVIQEHDFQETKNSLKKYAEQVQQDVELSRVPTDGGLFNLGDHKVTGYELNRITSQIQDYLIRFNTLNQGLVDEFREVYNAFEYLDKDYISGIVASIKAIQKVSEQEQKDRKDIRQLVDQHEQSVAVLKKFKADIDKLKHLTDIDKVWELIEKQASAINRIEKRQEEKFEELLVNQSSALEQISSNQSIKLAEINKSFEEEKTVYRDQINVLTKKVKFLYIVAGGATALTVIQLILNFLGIL